MSRKNQKGNYMWVPQKLSHICSCIYFFHKVLILKSKCLFLVVKEKKFSDIQVVLIMPWLSVNSFVFSLDWKIHFHLDFFLKLLRCSKGDVSDVFCWQLYEMNPQNLDDEVMENRHKIRRMNWHVTAMISYICFLFLLLGVSG